MNSVIVERFNRFFTRGEGCWIWRGGDDGRYGTFSPTRKNPEKAHRVSWLIHVGPIPEGMFVLHKCDNGFCVNPAHLFLGTQSDNMQDCANKGRHGRVTMPEMTARGDRHPKRNPDARTRAEKVKQLHLVGVLPAEIARRVGLSAKYVQDIIRGRYWSGNKIRVRVPILPAERSGNAEGEQA